MSDTIAVPTHTVKLERSSIEESVQDFYQRMHFYSSTSGNDLAIVLSKQTIIINLENADTKKLYTNVSVINIDSKLCMSTMLRSWQHCQIETRLLEAFFTFCIKHAADFKDKI